MDGFWRGVCGALGGALRDISVQLMRFVSYERLLHVLGTRKKVFEERPITLRINWR
jgi:hypothetical protein